jgi:hypothetical protein
MPVQETLEQKTSPDSLSPETLPMVKMTQRQPNKDACTGKDCKHEGVVMDVEVMLEKHRISFVSLCHQCLVDESRFQRTTGLHPQSPVMYWTPSGLIKEEKNSTSYSAKPLKE